YRLTSGPKITIDAPANGAVVIGDSVLVTGTVQGPSNTGVAVSGKAATRDASGRFYAMVALQPGSNEVTAVASAPNGQTDSRTIAVTWDGVPAPVQIEARPLEGLAPFTAN